MSRRIARLSISALALAFALASGTSLPACSSPVKPPVTDEPGRGAGAAAAPEPPGAERRGTVRIAATPGPKRFQGVWLELEGGARWVIDYRAHDVWRPFADRAVLVSGRCYAPQGHAILAQHFEVDRMRFADPGRPDAPILEVGPETRMRGVFAEVAYPEGSKLAGSKDLVFRADGGAEHRLFGADRGKLPLGERVAIDVRPVERNLAYTAGPGGPHLWLLGVRAPDTGELASERTYGACPEPGGS